ncbi:hypothetical protein [Actinoplanes teichomyceticus]|uniref:hypothetical protein n=1 Tax=Actinoplanes teichomyceticus TaxID=1867 RepID=UPI0011A5AA35|nr:hypothetical protein [Actinoplanes teichomyceticus]
MPLGGRSSAPLSVVQRAPAPLARTAHPTAAPAQRAGGPAPAARGEAATSAAPRAATPAPDLDTLFQRLEPRHVDALLGRLDDRQLHRLIKLFRREHLDALAHRLTDPVQRLLRAEMRTSRERSARLRDGWR